MKMLNVIVSKNVVEYARKQLSAGVSQKESLETLKCELLKEFLAIVDNDNEITEKEIADLNLIDVTLDTIEYIEKNGVESLKEDVKQELEYIYQEVSSVNKNIRHKKSTI